mgnify:CR=1 FL=1
MPSWLDPYVARCVVYSVLLVLWFITENSTVKVFKQ